MIVSYLEGFWKRGLVGLLLCICVICGHSSSLLTWNMSALSLWACRTVKLNDINCMQSIWLISTNTRFLSFFLFHAPSFILLLYCTFELKSHNTKFASFPYKPYAICEMLLPLWFSLVLVQLYADRLSCSPADPALTLPPISFNKLTQAQTWDSSSYSVPSEGDSDNGRWPCTYSSMCSLISQWMYWTLVSVQLRVDDIRLHACSKNQWVKLESRVQKSAWGLFSSSCRTAFN